MTILKSTVCVTQFGNTFRGGIYAQVMQGGLVLLLCICGGVLGQLCPVDIPDNDRRDCYPWSDANRENCEDRGCVWCETEQPNTPFCFYNDKVCPSDIPENERVDCLPEGGGKNQCTAKGCIWCETSTGGIPWCFDDPDVSMGGDRCPNNLDPDHVIDCHPEEDAGMNECLQRGCYWCPGPIGERPWCGAPEQLGYRIQGDPIETPEGYRVQLSRINTPSWFGGDVQNIVCEVELQTESRLRIKFSDPGSSRFEVPLDIEAGPRPSNPLYDVQFTDYPVFSIQVVRRSTGAVIFDTTMGGLTFSDQFLQIATRLDSDKLYGFGEHEHRTFKHPMRWEKWGMWARDQAVTDSNLYGVQPFYINVEQSNNAHGVLLLNANAQDVTLTPGPGIVWRTTGGVLDFYMFLGPSVENVVQQFNGAVGMPVMPPYWALGFQLCRWGYSDIDHMKAAVGRMRQYDIPHDVQYGDIDYMEEYRDFTIDDVNFAGLRGYVDQLKAEGTRFVIILDPALSYTQAPGTYPAFDRGEALDVWVKDAQGDSARGAVWPGPTYFPDYTKPSCADWWIQECVLFKEEMDYAGLWIDMNEPANFTDLDNDPNRCAYNRFNNPPFLPAIADDMIEKTLCMDTQQELGMAYDVHSLYGWSMAEVSFRAAREATGKRSIVFSRSTFPGAGKWGQHWLGDNFSTWAALRYSIIGLMEFNLFGMPYTGSDICGFIGETNEELCIRWQQLGAFYTFSRNHNANGNPDQDPGIWPSVAQATRESLLIRYELLPYLYTLFHQSHTVGSTVVRSLMAEFTSDSTTHEIQEQFLWGPAFLISPCLYQGARTVNAYFPDSRWYDWQTGAEQSARMSYATVDADLMTIPCHIRGGYVIPTQAPANSTLFSRENPMRLIVALDDSGSAAGTLFWDDGESQDTQENMEYFHASYSVSNRQLTATVDVDGYPGANSLEMASFTVLGEDTEPSSVTLNGDSVGFSYDSQTQVLSVQTPGLSTNSEFTLVWG